MVQAALAAGLSIADNDSIKAFASELLTRAQGTVVEYVLCHVDYIFPFYIVTIPGCLRIQ